MSYVRGACYIWRDDERVHVWVDDGYDGWDDSGWIDGRRRPRAQEPASTGMASGVGVQQEVADAYVVMRLAELVCEGRVRAVVESALARFGDNGGCLALRRLGDALIGALEPLSSHAAAADVRSLWTAARDDRGRDSSQHAE